MLLERSKYQTSRERYVLRMNGNVTRNILASSTSVHRCNCFRLHPGTMPLDGSTNSTDTCLSAHWPMIESIECRHICFPRLWVLLHEDDDPNESQRVQSLVDILLETHFRCYSLHEGPQNEGVHLQTAHPSRYSE